MRTASILLTLVFVLSFATGVGAREHCKSVDLSFDIGSNRFGFADFGPDLDNPVRYTMLYAGPIGWYEVPFTATQGLIGFYCILVMLIFLPVVFTFRWRRKRVAD